MPPATAPMMSSSSSASEIIEEKLAGKIVPGPAAATLTIQYRGMVRPSSLDLIRMVLPGVTVEMYDAYNAQVCHAMAAEATTLAKVRLTRGVNNVRSRIIEEPMEAFPIIAATGTSDAEWSSIVAWSIHTLVSAGTPTTHWVAGGTELLPVEAPELGLTKGWQERVVKAAGPYASMHGRNLGEGSIYKLPLGLNGTWQTGGLMLPPHAE